MKLNSSIIYLLAVLFTASCKVKNEKDQLPFFGNTIYEENDTIYHTIQDFSLVNQDSIIVTNETFNEKIYVADFFFTSCPTICPIMKSQMLRVYEKFQDNEEFAILSHTIDPKYDTVELLKNYAENLGVSGNTWHFLTGDQDYIYDLAEGSYISIADKDKNAPGGFVHSGAFLLVDKEKRIRGVYDGTIEEEVNILISDIDILLKAYEIN